MVVDDHEIVTDILKEALSLLPDVQVEVALTGYEAVALCLRERPDLLLLDLKLPDMNGLDVVTYLRPRQPKLRVVIFSGQYSEFALVRAARLNVAGFCLKGGLRLDELRAGVWQVLEGGVYYPPIVREAMTRLRQDPFSFDKILTAREIDLIPYLSSGDTDEQIAAQLKLSPMTVRQHRRRVIRKLGFYRSEELMRWAAEKGFIDFQK